MTAIDPATCWVPVPVRWRYVQPGDVTVTRTGGLLTIESMEPTRYAAAWSVTVFGEHVTHTVDPDEMVSILVPVPERDARALVLEDLATHVIGRRTVGAA